MTTAITRDEMILGQLWQVELLARRLHARCPQVELEDLVSAGTIGLIQAVDRFDGSVKLNTYAEHRIRGALLDYLRQIDPLPRSVRQFQKRRDAVVAELAGRGECVTSDAVAAALGVSVRKYGRLSAMVVASETVALEEVGAA